MEHRAVVDVVCKTAVTNLAGEIGVLLGKELQCTDVQLRLTAKDAFFNEFIRDKSALTRMTVSGDRTGSCYLLNQIDSAVYLGGTLIMLPEDMIEENAEKGVLDGELEDAFGEVANIIAGVFTQAFVDKYPKTIRFVKDTVDTLVPTKIDLPSDEPFPPGSYYVASCVLKADERDLGPVEFIVPADIFGLEEAAAPAELPPAEAADAAPAAGPSPAAPPPAENQPTPASEPAPVAKAAPKPAFADAKKLADVVFKATISQIGEEVGALIGQDLKCSDIQLLMTSKVDFFEQHCQEKSVFTQMKVSGDRTGLGYLAVQVPDAIILGGTLIMLPEEQIDEQVQKKDFSGEVADSFGEIANILAGSLTQVFADRYPQPLHFTKTEAETIAPTKLDLSSDQPFAEGHYYLASFAVQMEGYEPQRILLLFPGEIFDLDPDQPEAKASAPAAAAAIGPETASASGPKPQTEPAVAPSGPPLILVISENPDEAEPFVNTLSSAEQTCKVVGYQDDIRAIFQQHLVTGVFLVMNQVGERGFATAIKLQSTGRPLPPMIFAGPEWTRSAVLRAVKYGARDIIMIPASNDEIEQKVSQHIRKAS